MVYARNKEGSLGLGGVTARGKMLLRWICRSSHSCLGPAVSVCVVGHEGRTQLPLPLNHYKSKEHHMPNNRE